MIFLCDIPFPARISDAEHLIPPIGTMTCDKKSLPNMQPVVAKSLRTHERICRFLENRPLPKSMPTSHDQLGWGNAAAQKGYAVEATWS